MEDGLEDLNVSVAGPSGENGKMIRVGEASVLYWYALGE